MAISSIGNYINRTIGRGMNHTATKWFAKGLEKGLKHPAEYAAYMTVLSIVTKDIINCAFYTYQSMTNKKIPEDKRGFVAALDFVNGIINVGGQIGAFLLVDRFLMPKLQGWVYTGVFKDPKTGVETIMPKSKAPLAPDNIHEHLLKVMKEKSAELKEALKDSKGLTYDNVVENAENIGKDLIKKIGHSSSKGKDIATGFGVVITSLATTALIKRTLTPLIATPLAGKLKDRFVEEHNKKPEDKSDKMLEATYKPWLDKTYGSRNDVGKENFDKTA